MLRTYRTAVDYGGITGRDRIGGLWRPANNPGTTLAWRSRDKDGPQAWRG
jgi:hypothetical protein